MRFPHGSGGSPARNTDAEGSLPSYMRGDLNIALQQSIPRQFP
jgi:hypothetical protein